MDTVGKYEVKTFPSSRLATEDICHIGSRKHYVQALLELDVTEARKLIRQSKKLSGSVSFTAWLIKCVADVCSECKEIHAAKAGRRKIIVFDDVDISILVEKEVSGEKVPLPYVIRKTNEKSILQIHEEIAAARDQQVRNEGDYVLGGGRSASLMKMFYSCPGFLRRFFINRMIKNPITAKKQMGTVVMTSLGMMGRFNGWFVPIGVHPLIIAVGSINKKPGVVGDSIEAREYLDITVLVDHDVVDGAPAARALAKLIRAIESGYGLQ